MDGPRNYHAKWSQSDSEIPTSYAITYMCNLKKRTQWTSLQNRYWLTDTEKLMAAKGDSLGVEGWAGGLEWKCYKIGLWWWLYNYKCNKNKKIIKRERKKKPLILRKAKATTGVSKRKASECRKIHRTISKTINKTVKCTKPECIYWKRFKDRERETERMTVSKEANRKNWKLRNLFIMIELF